jgi:prephenate dehydrogenase
MLIKELDFFIKSLEQYRDAMANGDKASLRTLLEEGRSIKEVLDGR